MIDISQLQRPDIKEKLKSKEWRISHLYKIRDKDEKIVQFSPRTAQKHFFENSHWRNIILKSRRLGFTTFEAIDMLDDVLWNPNKDALFIAHTEKVAVEIFQNILNFSWETFPLKELYKVSTDRANQLKFDFGDGSFSSVKVASSGRGGGFGRVHISEFGKLCKYYPAKATEVITGTIPAVPLSGRIDIESTAEGEGGPFYEMFWEAWLRGEPKYPSDFKAHFYNWRWDTHEVEKAKPYIEEFKKSDDKAFFLDYQKKHKLTDMEITYYFMQWLSFNKKWWMLRQEMPFTPEEAFTSSGNKVFNQEALQEQKTKKGTRDGQWEIFEEYQVGSKYVMGADVALGVGRDSSTAVVLKLGIKAEVVAIFEDKNIPPDLFAHELKRYAVKYGSCLVAPERNSMGDTTVRELLKIYKNVYKDVNYKRETEFRMRPQAQNTLQYGFITTASSKPFIIGEVRQAIEEEALIINSDRLLFEMKTYDKEDLGNVRFNPEATNHWDILMSLCIAYHLRTKHNPANFQRPTYMTANSGNFSRPSYY